MFYLNYVGCKVKLVETGVKKEFSFTLTMWDVKFNKKSLNLRSMLGFTLTMWDVKAIDKGFTLIHGEFYLNYVGCKDSLFLNIENLFNKVLP